MNDYTKCIHYSDTFRDTYMKPLYGYCPKYGYCMVKAELISECHVDRRIED